MVKSFLFLSVLSAAFCLSTTACNGYLPLKGDTGAPGAKGETGVTGAQGPVGSNGADGQDCTVSAVLGGTQITCGSTVQVVLNGTNGTVVTPIALCPNLAGGLFTEYLVRIGNDLFGVYASGQKIGYTKLWAGTWITSDGRNCQFTVNSDNTVTY